MSAPHTPGRLKIGERQRGIFVILEKIDECPVGGTFSPDDARRLVACWNACEGISTEALETGPTMMVAFEREQNRADLAEVQRDDLLAALNGLLSYFESGNRVPISQATIKANSSEVLAARAAIAKAGGEA